ncbi:hypothetical protein OOK31_03130 [Streptomyces sp. NBC_00249]|uniref:hypothetical protein n=1 Tax=Streptomyces sp. NBC_00249 TaxID=2975690 RepID=UPI002259AED4|nr:hypothetical protein [Streptomyces sp. NBC_00249]MCX5192896.1 hypothetical protein [Streptomyces sp. NBC_00249]
MNGPTQDQAGVRAVLGAAEAALGSHLYDATDLGGSARSTVLRCRSELHGSVVVKAYADDPAALGAFPAEAAGLSLGLAGPALLAADPGHPLIVMRDLGSGPTLADLLLGADSATAQEALLGWSRALGDLAARSVAYEAEFDAGVERYRRGHPTWMEGMSQLGTVGRLPELLDRVEVVAPPGLDADIAEIRALADSPYKGLTPGDTCPDNSMLTGDGMQLLDFEGAGYQPVFLTAAYCRMPFATCWCAFRLPGNIGRRAEAAFRRRLLPVYPQLADDTVWEHGMRRAVAAWSVMTLGAVRYATEEDYPLHSTRRPAPMSRQLLTYRWQSLLRDLEPSGDLPAFAELLRALLADRSALWQPEPLPAFPALLSRPAM